MENRNRLIVFLKRFLLITVTFIAVVLLLYGCSSVGTLNKYEYNLNNDIGSIYRNEDNTANLRIISDKEAELVAENTSLIYSLSIKDNVLFLDGQENRNVFIVLSDSELLWQTQNTYLFKEIKETVYEN